MILKCWWRDNIKIDVQRNRLWICEIDFTGLRQDLMMSFSEHSDEPPHTITKREFLSKLNDFHLLKIDSVPWNLLVHMQKWARAAGIQFPAGARFFFSPSHPDQLWILGALSVGVRWLVFEADYSPPSSTEIKNVWSFTSTDPIRFLALCLGTGTALYHFVHVMQVHDIFIWLTPLLVEPGISQALALVKFTIQIWT